LLGVGVAEGHDALAERERRGLRGVFLLGREQPARPQERERVLGLARDAQALREAEGEVAVVHGEGLAGRHGHRAPLLVGQRASRS